MFDVCSTTCNCVAIFFSKSNHVAHFKTQLATALLALVTQLATTLFSSRSSSNYVVDVCSTTCNYVAIVFSKSNHVAHFKTKLATALLALVTQLATTLLSSRSSSNYVVDVCNTTCNYVVIFSVKFQLRCRIGELELPAPIRMWLTWPIEKGQCYSQMVQRVIPVHCIGRELGILHEYVSHHRLKY